MSLRRFVFLLALVPVLFGIVSLTRFESRVRLMSDGTSVQWDFRGSVIQTPVPLRHITRVEIFATHGLLPVGGRSIRLEEHGRVVIDEELPRRFKLRSGTTAPVGDWWVDGMNQSPATLVWSRDVDVRGPFTLEAAFTGRCQDATRIVLHSDTGQLGFDFRWGLINHDFAIIRPPHEILTAHEWQPKSGPPVLSAIETLARALIAAIVVALVFTVIAWAGRRWRGLPLPRPHWSPRACVVVALALALGLGVAAYWCWGHVLNAVPHLPDSLVYLLQAKWLLAGRLYLDPPPFAQQLDIPLTFVKDGKWLAHYPIGWPLLLAIGEALSDPGLVAPLFGALSVVFVFLIGRTLWGPGLGLVAVVFCVLSPMTVLLSAEPMSHAASAALIQCAFWLILAGAPEARFVPLALAGAAMGYAFGMRPLTALAMSGPLALYVLLAGGAAWTRRLVGLGLFTTGAIVGALPVLVANAKTTGRPFLFAYTWAGGHVLRLDHVRGGLVTMDATLASMLPALHGWGWPWLNGWPLLALGLGLAFIPFLVGGPRRAEWLLLSGFLVLPLAYTLHGGHGLHGYGARFYYEGFFCLHLLVARGFQRLASVDGATREPGRIGAPAIAATAFCAALTVSAAVSLPGRVRLYRGYNYVTGNFDAALARAGITKGLVLLQGQWFDWAEVGRHLGADLSADLAFARYSDKDNSAVFDFYPDRPVFTWAAPMFVDAQRDLSRLK